MQITEAASIEGPGADVLTIDAKQGSRIFYLSGVGGQSSISGLTLTGGQVDGARGGAIFARYSPLEIADSTLSENSALGISLASPGRGGAVAVYSSQLSIVDTTLTGNSAAGSGGAVNVTTSDLAATNTTFSGNSAGQGGAIAESAGGTLNLDSATVVDNLAESTRGAPGGGILLDVLVTANLDNTILANNDGPGTSSDDVFTGYGSSATLTYSLLESPGNANIVDGGNNIFGQDPNLATLADNGGPTQTQALQTGSPAIEAGNTALATDQRGVTRPQGSADDIGAYELDTTPPGVTISSPGRISDQTPAIPFSSPDADTASFECRLDSGQAADFAPCTSPFEPASPLSDGPHALDVRATDKAKNTGSPERATFTVDTTGPEATIDSHPPSTTTDHTPTFEFSSPNTDGDLQGFRCRIDAGSFAACSSPFTSGRLDAGSHSFEVKALDDLGNQGPPASYAFTVSEPGPRARPRPRPRPGPTHAHAHAPTHAPAPELRCPRHPNPIIGTEQGETILGTEAADLIEGHGGRDTIIGAGGDDCLYGNAGRDVPARQVRRRPALRRPRPRQPQGQRRR